MSITVGDLLLVLFLSTMIGFALWGAATSWDLSLSEVIIAAMAILIAAILTASVTIHDELVRARKALEQVAELPKKAEA